MPLRKRGSLVWQAWRLASDVLRRRPIGAGTPPWLPVLARWRRAGRPCGPERYEAIIDQFAVEKNARYRRNAQGRGETYCNIFVWDVTRAMGAEIPHWVTERGEPALPPHAIETTANGAIAWLRGPGSRYGWREVEMREAQAHASRGGPAVAAWRNEPGIGHMAMLRPGPTTDEGPLLADAGDRNHARARAARVFVSGWQRGDLAYFIHD